MRRSRSGRVQLRPALLSNTPARIDPCSGDAGRPNGIVSGTDLLSTFAAHEVDQPVTGFARFEDKGATAIPVVSNGDIVRLLTMENGRDYLLIRKSTPCGPDVSRAMLKCRWPATEAQTPNPAIEVCSRAGHA